MTDVSVPQAYLVRDVLAKHWRIKEQIIRTHLGVSRATWRIGCLYWLSQTEHFRFAEQSQQATLLDHLNPCKLFCRHIYSNPYGDEAAVVKMHSEDGERDEMGRRVALAETCWKCSAAGCFSHPHF